MGGGSSLNAEAERFMPNTGRVIMRSEEAWMGAEGKQTKPQAERVIAVVRLTLQSSIWQAVREGIPVDPVLAAIQQQLQADMLSGKPTAITDKYSVKYGCLLRKRRLHIPGHLTELQEQIMHDFHNAPVAGHCGIDKKYHRVKKYFW